MSAEGVIWTERFRPESLDDVIGHEQSVERLKKYVDDPSIPHMLFAGPPGTGKTAATVAFARDVFGPSWKSNMMEMNASDERGIDTIRDKVKRFARSSPVGEAPYQIIFLDEADQLCLPPGTKVITGYPSNRKIKQIEEISTEGEPIPSVSFDSNEVQSDKGRMLETGTADFYQMNLSDGREVVASPKHPFFTVGSSQKLIETQLRDLSPGDEIADFQNEIGVSQCDCCNEWTGNSRFCSIECKDKGHSEDMSGEKNPMHGETWDPTRRKKIISKLSDGRLKGEKNPRYSHGGYVDYQKHREYLGDSDVVECEMCGSEEKNGGHDGIDVHHIDEDRSNNSPENLMALCKKCHHEKVHRKIEKMDASNPLYHDGGRNEVETIEIESIEYSHHGKAYNITMDGTPNFMLSNGILTHNTKPAQASLRRIMEEYSDGTRFFLTCNYPNQIIEAIQSRCSVFRFGRLSDEEIRSICNTVIEREGLEVSDEAFEIIVQGSNGDARKVINTLQQSAFGGKITEDTVSVASNAVDDSIVAEIIDLSISGNADEAMEMLDTEFLKEGVNSNLLGDAFLRVLKSRDMPGSGKMKAISKLGTRDQYIREGGNESLQWHALLSDIFISAHLTFGKYEGDGK